jgi:hypothetical protein
VTDDDADEDPVPVVATPVAVELPAPVGNVPLELSPSNSGLSSRQLRSARTSAPSRRIRQGPRRGASSLALRVATDIR